MRPNRPLGAASHPARVAKVSRSRHLRAAAARVLPVTALAAVTCTLWAGAASAATAGAVAKHNTTTAITNASPGHTDVGMSFTFDITVASTGGPAATGTVKVEPTSPPGLPPAYSCTATISGGMGTCTITPPEYGIVDYAARYSGDAAHNGSTYAGPFTLAVQNVTTTTVKPAKAAAGPVKLSAEVYAMGADIDKAHGGTGSVAFYIAASPAGTPTIIKGCAARLLRTFTGPPHFYNVARCTDTLTAGTYYVTAVYSGDRTNVTSTSPVHKLVVSSPSPGVLSVWPATVTLSPVASGGPYTGQFQLTAQGGPVSSFSIEDPAPPGDLIISPSSGGPIAAGQSVTITVTVASAAGLAFETDLTVNPGGLTVAIDYPPAG
jgi:hypothetical protein